MPKEKVGPGTLGIGLTCLHVGHLAQTRSWKRDPSERPVTPEQIPAFAEHPKFMRSPERSQPGSEGLPSPTQVSTPNLPKTHRGREGP